MKATLCYLHDPMCSWCWGFRPVWDEIQERLESNLPELDVVYIVGGLAPDCDDPMPLEMRSAIEGYWKRIATELGTTFNHAFWTENTPRRSTYLACRAVLAAKRQHREYEMIDAIQKGYYLRAMNPSDEAVLIQLAEEILDHGCDSLEQFCSDLRSTEIEQELQQHIRQSRQFQRQGLANGFPSLVLNVERAREREESSNGGSYAIDIDYKDANAVCSRIESYFTII